MSVSDNMALFRQAIISAGLEEPPEAIEPGRLHRFSTNGKRHDDAGWAKLFEDCQGGVFGDFRSGLHQVWQAERSEHFTPAERKAFRQRCEAERLAREAEKASRHAEAAKKAGEVLATATGDPATHPYAVKKQVPFGPLVRRGLWPQRDWPDALLVPLYDGDGQVWTIEAINADGDKDSLKDGRKTGCFHPLEEIRGASRVLVAEGLANAAVSRAVDGSPAVAAMGKANLIHTALAVRNLAPEAQIIIIADNDLKVPKEAQDAARAADGRVVVPELDGRESDIWEWHERGAEAAREAIVGAEAPALDEIEELRRKTAGDSSDVPPLSDRPCFRVFDEWVNRQDGKLQPGVWYFAAKQSKKADEPPILIQQWVCSPLYIDAVAEDGQDLNFGRLLRFRNTLGRWREWSMPMEMLKSYGDELRGELLAMGVEINPLSKVLLGQYLQSVHPDRAVRCALQVGWCGDNFVLPDTVIGPTAEDVIYQSGERQKSEYSCGGTFAGWKAEVAARAVGNPLLIQAISASFCGPLLMRCVAEGGGIHFTGDSSIGKSRAIRAACSTWGGEEFFRSWKATSNGMEGAAALSNDGLLGLDEIGEADPRDIGLIIYSLANGLGKQRATRHGSARPRAHWRTFVLSSGEQAIATRMLEGGRQAHPGQSVRMLDVPVHRGEHGAWQDLHGLPSGERFSNELKRAALTHYGHAGRAFLEKLTRDTINYYEELERIKALPGFRAEGGEGQDQRAAARFALMALAGELATEYGITGWEEGTAIEAAAAGLKAWRSLRGPRNDERRQILEAVSSFIERHGDSRFSSAEEAAEAITRDRAGWWKDSGGERVYLFTSDGMREALRGFDFNPALTVLQEAGALPPADASGRRSTNPRIGGRRVRVYGICADKLEAGFGTPGTP